MTVAHLKYLENLIVRRYNVKYSQITELMEIMGGFFHSKAVKWILTYFSGVCCFLPFCITSMQDHVHTCPKCKHTIATKRLMWYPVLGMLWNLMECGIAPTYSCVHIVHYYTLCAYTPAIWRYKSVFCLFRKIISALHDRTFPTNQAL